MNVNHITLWVKKELRLCLPVPPNILDSLSTESTVAVREHQNITLTCKADGYPPPKLMWKREDGQVISINKHHKGTLLY